MKNKLKKFIKKHRHKPPRSRWEAGMNACLYLLEEEVLKS
ncbi:hypothetical protein ES702_01808 [subsurface metagenome]